MTIDLVGNPLAEAVRLELMLWKHIPEELCGRIVANPGEIDALLREIPNYSGWAQTYLRQHRNREVFIRPLCVYNAQGGLVGLGTNENGVTKGYDVYSKPARVNSDIFHNVAYGCGECGNILLGPPITQDFPLGDLSSFLIRRNNPSIKYYCAVCKLELDNFNLSPPGETLEGIVPWSNGCKLHLSKPSTLTKTFSD